MIRARTAPGELRDLQDARFVEILTSDLKLAACIWIDDGDVVHVTHPGDRDFERYLQAFGLSPAKVIQIDKTLDAPQYL